MIKAVFFDIDGTLVSFQTHTVSPAVLQGLHRLRQQGIRLFLSTGRHKSIVQPVRDLFPFDGCITLSGQYCFAQDRVLRSVPFAPEGVDALVGLMERSSVPCIFLEEDDCYLVNPGPRSRVFPDQLAVPLPPSAPARRAVGRQVFQATAFLTREEQQTLEDPFPGLEVMRWHPDFVDVISPGGGKDRGMDAILDFFGISLEETMAFGDGENDIPMLRHAHIGVAMGNADALVRSQADFVTGTVDEDGILSALEHFGLL